MDTSGLTLTPELTYAFTSDTEGWESLSVPELTAAGFATGDGALKLLSAANASDAPVFGYWASTLDANSVVIEAGKAYMARFQVLSNVPAQDAPQVPGLRVRMHEESFQTGVVTHIESLTGAISPVVGSPKEYDVFFQPPASAVDKRLIVAFDMLKNTTDSDTAELWLDEVTIYSVPLP